MATFRFIGGPLILEPLAGGVSLSHGNSLTSIPVMLPNRSVVELVELLDRALDGPSEGVIGRVHAINGRNGERCALHVLRSAASVDLRRNPKVHSGWSARLRDQVEELRNALNAHVAVAVT